MSITKNHSRIVRPPPFGTIFPFAADGLAVRNGNVSSSGKPRTPEMDEWVPEFRQYLESPEGQRTLKELAEVGIRVGKFPKVYIECVEAAFRNPRFYELAKTALEEFADIAPKRFTIPEPPRHPPAADTRPRPETPKSAPPKPEPPSPSRPRPRPRGPRLTP